MKRAIQTLAPKYNSDRMVEEYARRIYSDQPKNAQKHKKRAARRIALWGQQSGSTLWQAVSGSSSDVHYVDHEMAFMVLQIPAP